MLSLRIGKSSVATTQGFLLDPHLGLFARRRQAREKQAADVGAQFPLAMPPLSP
jgi:hypothetical protein